MVDLAQIGGRDRDLDRAGHRECRIAVDADGFSGREIDRGDADVAGLRADKRLELLLKTEKVRRRRRMYGLQGKGQQPEKDSNKSHWALYPRTAVLLSASSPKAHIRSKL